MTKYGRPSASADVEQGQDARLPARRRDARLAHEPLGVDPVRELRAQHLDRDRAVHPQVAREIHDLHPAAADLALDHVPVPDRARRRLVARRRAPRPAVRVRRRGGARERVAR
ncbi:hypothetical protein tb265_06490 [Gemmatimonadetes bacterium T265]|nr:hypothetical protein tb265_06490 [Gemmatimonadetes bacterium T265]